MSGDVANPRIWEGADVFIVPVGTTMPTNTTTALSSTILAGALGLISEDGMTGHGEFQNSETKYAHGNIAVRKSRSRYEETLTVTALESQAVNVWNLAHPGSTAVSAAGVTTRTVKIPSVTAVAALLEMKDPAGVTMRRAIPRIEFEPTGDHKFTDSDMEGTDFVGTIIPSSTGVLYFDITDDPAAVVA
jgi:hypothetical protein